MGKKGGRNKLKRLAAPRGWDITRKKERFVYKPDPGPHPGVRSYPLGVVLRDLAGLATKGRELKHIVNSGNVLVDGRVRKSLSFPVGLFDVIRVPSEQASYRMVPSPRGLLLSRVPEEEAGRKLCSIRSKVKSKGGKTQYGLHDGRTVIDDSLQAAPGDSLLVELPDQKAVANVKLAKDAIGLVLSGDRAGQSGKIVEVKKGTISRERTVTISLPGGDAELPARLVFAVGTESPMITVGPRSPGGQNV
jgi:small subunit ribosomal protein S4e